MKKKDNLCFYLLDNETTLAGRMASVNRTLAHKSLEIKTKSIETTLVPLVTQISTLVNFKEKPRSATTNEKTLQAINRVGDAVHMAVERFVSVGKDFFIHRSEEQISVDESISSSRRIDCGRKSGNQS